MVSAVYHTIVEWYLLCITLLLDSFRESLNIRGHGTGVIYIVNDCKKLTAL